jgi:hypothetical protein
MRCNEDINSLKLESHCSRCNVIANNYDSASICMNCKYRKQLKEMIHFSDAEIELKKLDVPCCC